MNCRLRFIGLVCWIILLHSLALSEAYVVHSYTSNNPTSYNVSVSLINLNTLEIIDNIELPMTGTIMNKKPIVVLVDDQELFLCFTLNGCMGKNADLSGNGEVLYYSVYTIRDNSIQLLHTDSLSAVIVDYVEQLQGESGFRLSIRDALRDNYLFDPGLYSIDNNFDFSPISPIENDNEMPGYIEQIDEFENLNIIRNAEADHLYYSFHNSQYWLLKLDTRDNSIVDSLQLRYSGGQATIFGYHPLRDKFYCFHTNYEIHGKFVEKSRENYYITPDVQIYNPLTLELMESFGIPDYPEGNYPGKENGAFDTVGDYIIYYFFEDDWFPVYAPAMLFIFNTRTNEASWLRVGWR